MTKNEIIGEMARKRLAERIVGANCREMAGRPELADLAQMAYLALLEMDEERIRRAHSEGWLPFLLRRIILNQSRTDHSPWRDLFRKYGLKCVELTAEYEDIPD